MGICNASKETSEISDTCSTDAKYFVYEDAVDKVKESVLHIYLVKISQKKTQIHYVVEIV
mgnify:FL=1|jgi:hypothetical protein